MGDIIVSYDFETEQYSATATFSDGVIGYGDSLSSAIGTMLMGMADEGQLKLHFMDTYFAN